VQRRGEALEKRLDPSHSPKGVKVQLGPGYTKGGPPMGGFVRNYIESRKEKDFPPGLWMVPMGYYTRKDLPLYDHLARRFCVCDRWFASIPGDTWPNRMYAMTGKWGPNVALENDLWDLITRIPGLKKLRGLPVFDEPAFTRHLGADQWRWYSHDPGTLRLADSHYRQLRNTMRDNFRFFDRRKVGFVTEGLEAGIVGSGSFLDHAARGTLPQVSWIDPNFVDVDVLDPNSNDDHPPADIRAGQAFLTEVYDALIHSKNWDDTLLVITYDEHGGFYDHVEPPLIPAGDGSPCKTYGVRVPALIAGPRVRRGVLHDPPVEAGGAAGQPFDHTTLMKTILLAFAKQPEKAIAQMPVRVQRAPHLGSVLLDEPRTDLAPPQKPRRDLARWRKEARERRTAASAVDLPEARTREGDMRSVAPDGAGQPLILTDFQREMQNAGEVLRRAGLEP
jgi:phospholipase C